MKPWSPRANVPWHRVALFARAWIETGRDNGPDRRQSVALFARAWIETSPLILTIRRKPSPSSRGRGLKQFLENLVHVSDLSPSSRGRGLKQHARGNHGDHSRSPSSRGRGLKLRGHHQEQRRHPSPSSRGRGLKPVMFGPATSPCRVALFARAWIETMHGQQGRPCFCVALFARAWIETSVDVLRRACLWSPSSRGRGLKRQNRAMFADEKRSPSSRGRGLKHTTTRLGR